MSNYSLSPPSHSDAVKISFPIEHVVLLTMNRPKSLNAMWHGMEGDLETLLNWFEGEPSLWSVLCALGCWRASFHGCQGWRLLRAMAKHSAPVPI
jgi:hypothetical protein